MNLIRPFTSCDVLQWQVMVDNTGTTRLEWRAWDIFTKLPVGMVAYTEENQFVARVKRGSGFRDAIQCRRENHFSDLITPKSILCSSLDQFEIQSRFTRGNCCHEISQHQ